MKETVRILRNVKIALREIGVMNKREARAWMIIEREIWGKDSSILKTWRNFTIELHFWVRKEEGDFRKYSIFALTCAYLRIDEMSYLNLKRNCKIDRNKTTLLIRVSQCDMKFIWSKAVLD